MCSTKVTGKEYCSMPVLYRENGVLIQRTEISYSDGSYSGGHIDRINHAPALDINSGHLTTNRLKHKTLRVLIKNYYTPADKIHAS